MTYVRKKFNNFVTGIDKPSVEPVVESGRAESGIEWPAAAEAEAVVVEGLKTNGYNFFSVSLI